MSLSLAPDMRTFVSGACDASAKVSPIRLFSLLVIIIGKVFAVHTNSYVSCAHILLFFLPLGVIESTLFYDIIHLI